MILKIVFLVDEMNHNILYINRGLPGSGKTTKARSLAPEENIFSNDDFWMKDGKYVFEYERMSEAIDWNFSRVIMAMRLAKTPIVVDNTHVRRRFFQGYTLESIKYNYKIIEVLPDSPWFLEIYPRILDKSFTEKDVNVFVEKNTHGVTAETIRKMMLEWEE